MARKAPQWCRRQHFHLSIFDDLYLHTNTDIYFIDFAKAVGIFQQLNCSRYRTIGFWIIDKIYININFNGTVAESDTLNVTWTHSHFIQFQFQFHSVSLNHIVRYGRLCSWNAACVWILFFLGAKETNRTGGRENEIAWTRYFFYRSSHWIVIFIARLYFVHFNSNCLASQLLFCWINPKRHICTRSPIFFQRICVYVIVNERKTAPHKQNTMYTIENIRLMFGYWMKWMHQICVECFVPLSILYRGYVTFESCLNARIIINHISSTLNYRKTDWINSDKLWMLLLGQNVQTSDSTIVLYFCSSSRVGDKFTLSSDNCRNSECESWAPSDI